MKRIFKLSIILAMLVAFVITGCKKNDDSGSVSFAPPAWIQGEWEWLFEYGIGDLSTIYKFTTNDIITTTDAVWMEDGPTVISFREYVKYGYSDIKETAKRDEIYELTVSSMGWNEKTVYNFRKGDGTYIELDIGEEEIFRCNKK